MSRKKNPNGMGGVSKKPVKGKDGVERVYWIGTYTDPITKKQKSVCDKTYAGALRKLEEKKAQITMGTYATPQRITVEQWLTEWLDRKSKKIQPSTVENYKKYIGYIVPHLGRVRLQDLRRAHCQDMIDALPKRLSPITIKGVKDLLHQACNEAVKREIITRNPAELLDVPKIVTKEPVALDSKMKMDFIAAAKETSYYNIYMIALETGCRISECLGLQWRSVDLDTGELIIQGQLDRRRNGQPVQYKPRTKNGKTRTLYLPQYAIEYLKDEKRKQLRNRMKAGTEWHNTDDLVFTREDGSPIPHGTLENCTRRIAKKIGHPEIHFHSLRKTFITEEQIAGTDVKTVSAIAGHSAIEITLKAYTASMDEQKRAAAQRRQERHDAEIKE